MSIPLPKWSHSIRGPKPNFSLPLLGTCFCFVFAVFISAGQLAQESNFVSIPDQAFPMQSFIEPALFNQVLAVEPTFVEQAGVKALPISYLPESRTFGTILEPASEGQRVAIEEYVAQAGDSLATIAEKFALALETVLWANNLSKSSKISIGDKLVILPVDGVIHHVKSGESLSYLVAAYKVPADKILAYNDLSQDGAIFIGDVLIIPGGKPLAKVSAPKLLPLADSLFICPLGSSCRLTQGLHWYNAVDLSNGGCGEPVFAVAAGRVQRTGFGSVSGKYIHLLHTSGIGTFFGHLSSILVVPGQEVSQGQLIGYTGHTGYTVPRGPAGCHLHFEVRGARNPFAY